MEKFKKMFRSVSSKNGTYSVGLVVIVIAIAIVVNMVAGQLPESVRNIDISENNIYEISEVTTDMLDALDKDIQIKVIAEQDAIDDRIKTFVKKYEGLSNKIDVEWLDSVLHPSVLQEYDTEGNVIIVSCEETGKQTSISFDDIVVYDEYTYYMTGQYSETEFDGEGQLTSAINYVASEETKKIYRTSGHGEGTFSTSVSDLFTKNNLETEEINLSMNPKIPDDCDLLFMYAPTADITDDEKVLIDDYLQNGGNVYLILGETTAETPNLNAIMETFGLQKTDGYIADMQRCYQGNYYAIFPQLTLSEGQSKGISNEMVLLLNSMGMETLEVDSDTLEVTTFMETSTDGYAVTENGETQGQFVLGAVATDYFEVESEEETEDSEDVGEEETEETTETAATGSMQARLTVLASESIISSDITDQLTTLDNLTLFINTVTDNFEDVETVAIEAKSLSIEQNTPLHAGGISIVVIFVVPAAIVLIGFVVWMKRRKA